MVVPTKLTEGTARRRCVWKQHLQFSELNNEVYGLAMRTQAFKQGHTLIVGDEDGEVILEDKRNSLERLPEIHKWIWGNVS